MRGHSFESQEGFTSQDSELEIMDGNLPTS
jgi:hypothetical protein